MPLSARQRLDMFLQQRRAQAPARPQSQSAAMLGAVGYANGGAVGGLPTLQELARPDYQWQDPAFGATAPFTQMQPTVPMFNLESQAFGGMPQDVFDWMAPSVDRGQFTTPVRQPAAETMTTSAYQPVQAVPGQPIPDVPVFPDQAPAPVAPAAPQQPVAPTQPTGNVPRAVSPDELAQRQAEQERQRQVAAQEEAARQSGIQAELERREAEERARVEAAMEAERQRVAQAEAAERARQEEIAAEAERQRLAQEQAARDAEAARQAEAEAARQAEAQRIAAEQAEAERRRQQDLMMLRTNPFLFELLAPEEFAREQEQVRAAQQASTDWGGSHAA